MGAWTYYDINHLDGAELSGENLRELYECYQQAIGLGLRFFTNLHINTQTRGLYSPLALYDLDLNNNPDHQESVAEYAWETFPGDDIDILY